ncbi:MAG: metallophosphoesterase family protein [Spirochaetes bacterium]|nr:metallophosphoesterase family protein [Spirochaetota bacterium]
MKIGLIADIHGNHIALKAVLDHLHKEHVDSIICLGDAYCPCPFSREIHALLEQHQVIMVKGNGEERIVDLHAKMMSGTDIPLHLFPSKHTMELCSLEQIKRIASLPSTMTLQDDTILLCHGTPENAGGFLFYLDGRPNVPVMERLRHRTVIAGHNHWQRTCVYGNTTVHYAGSIGYPNGYEQKQMAYFSIAHLDGRSCRMQFAGASYDNSAFIQSLLQADFIGRGGPMALLILDEFITQEDRLLPFFTYCSDAVSISDSAVLYEHCVNYLKHVGRWDDLLRILQGH